MFMVSVDSASVAGSVTGTSSGSAGSGAAASTAASTVTHFSVESLCAEQLPQGSDGDQEDAKVCPTCGGTVNKGKK